jgi:eukaryotic-like serine/threonine-protein kinase
VTRKPEDDPASPGELGEEDASRREPGRESTAAYVPGSEPTAPSANATGTGTRLAPGRSVAGRFVILRFIAQGGMGEVYEALDTELGSRVALKTILPAFAGDPDIVDRFRREVMLARRVTHGNVCRTYELYSIEATTGEPLKFITMEFLDGESLAQRLKRVSRLSLRDALPLLRQMGAALDAAHAQGVVHRDFKPSNVMLVTTNKGLARDPGSVRVVVTDFGIARAFDAGPEKEGTQTGALVGTPQYMAPEQLAGSAVTPATDIYALGVVLYEMLTGALPRPGTEISDSGLDARSSAVIRKCLSHEPHRRFADAGRVVTALTRRWPGLHRKSVMALVILAISAGIGGTLAIRHAQRSRNLEESVHFPRRSVALVPFRNRSDRSELSWLSLALEEGLSVELQAAVRDLRTIRDQRADRLFLDSSPGLDTRDAATRERFRQLLSADVLVAGDYALDVTATTLRVALTAVDSASGRVLAEWSEESLVDQVPTLTLGWGERLRTALGAAALTDGEQSALSASRPIRFEAMQLYAEGSLHNLRWDYNGARQLFEAAVAVDPDYVHALKDLAEVWRTLGDSGKAKEVAEKAFKSAARLSPLERLSIEGLLNDISGETKKTLPAYRERFKRYPDELTFARPLLFDEPPRAALVVVDALRRLPLPASEDLRLDLWEASVRQGTDEFPKAEALLRNAARKAEALGSKDDLALAYNCLAEVLGGEMGSPTTALESAIKAVDLYMGSGNLPAAGDNKLAVARYARAAGHLELSNQASAEGLAIFQRLGNDFWLHDALVRIFWQFVGQGNFRLAASYLDQAREERKAEGTEPLWQDVSARGYLALMQGDLSGARRDMAESKRIAADKGQWGSSSLEAMILREEDRLEEALALYERILDRYPRYDRYYRRELQARMGRLDCEQGRSAAGLSRIDSLRVVHANDLSEIAVDRAVEGSCFLQIGSLERAEKVGREGLAAAERTGDLWSRLMNAAILARATAARGDSKASIATLREMVSEAELAAYLPGLEMRLALGEVQHRAGRPEGHAQLMTLEQDARSRGFLRIARLATEALTAKPTAPAPR